jgi:hypothetical protein
MHTKYVEEQALEDKEFSVKINRQLVWSVVWIKRQLLKTVTAIALEEGVSLPWLTDSVESSQLAYQYFC